MDDFMKEAVYGCSERDRKIVGNIAPIVYVSEKSDNRIRDNGLGNNGLPEVPSAPANHDDPER